MNSFDTLFNKYPDANINIERKDNSCKIELSWKPSTKFIYTGVSVVRSNMSDALDAVLKIERV
ncbi:hypothetical protein UFOVP1290_192 [uncultured Caudovirales phage]|uniref:Uncharacterized protein n=1 Tax=uncultured Caudovirales phage TaxID=2100421 RepID=A0A6J5RKT2_9CAUD|nr:hypothetical protein UFOVP1290_192 [uncultured Caudovirales phage]